MAVNTLVQPAISADYVSMASLLRRQALILLIALCLGSVMAEEAQVGDFAPYVERIRVGRKDNQLFLTWEDNTGIKGRYELYRYTEMIKADNIGNAKKVADIERGTCVYEDQPDQEPVFYAILIRTDEGLLYSVFVPSQNVTSFGLDLGLVKRERSEPEPRREIVPEPSSLPLQRRPDLIKAQASDTAIRLELDLSAPDARFVIYRGTEAISNYSSLLRAMVIAIVGGKEREYLDYAVPGIEYYYAVVRQDELQKGRFSLIIGENSTALSTKLGAGPERASLGSLQEDARSIPLPEIRSGLLEGGRTRRGESDAPLALSPETEKAIAQMSRELRPDITEKPDFSLLPMPKGAAQNEYIPLESLVRESLPSKDWSRMAMGLERFLSINHAKNIDDLAHFYLGQALLQANKPREAFFHLLSAQDSYYTQSLDLLKYCLSVLD